MNGNGNGNGKFRRSGYSALFPIPQSLILGKGRNAVEVYPLVIRLASRIWNRTGIVGSVEYMDAVSEGLVAILRANGRFSHHHGVKLTTYVYRRVQGAIRDLLDAEMKYENLNERTDPAEIQGPSTSVVAFEDSLSNALLFEKVIRIVRTAIPVKHGIILFRYYLHDVPEHEIAEEIDETVWAVAKLRSEALQMVRACFPPSGEYVRPTDD